MEALKQKIIDEGVVVSDTILKVDSFLNHQIDPMLMQEIGLEFARRFKNNGVTKIITIEASGIAVALMTGFNLGVPVVFAKKKEANTMAKQFYTSEIKSHTRENQVTIAVAKEYLSADDRILIIDDFLATGEATKGLLNIINQSEAKLVGVGTAVEKSFQSGGQRLEEQGIRVEVLAKILSLENGKIVFG